MNMKFIKHLTLLLLMLMTSIVGAMAQEATPGKLSYFLETDTKGDYYVWPYGNGQGGDYFTGGGWMENGSKMTEAGTLPNDHFLYIWEVDAKEYSPTSAIIHNGEAGDANRIETPCANHSYFKYIGGTFTYSHYIPENIYKPQDSHTTYGKRVIYEMNVGSFTYDGTFAAAQAKLNELKAMGIDIIWIMPIFPRDNKVGEGAINSPYAATSFEAVNSSYGTKADLKAFVTAAHALGMDVILDIVPNHVSNMHPWVTSNSDYVIKDNHPYVDVTQLNYANSNLQNYMINMMKGWIDDTDVDGYRFDMVSSTAIPDAFWTSLASALREKKSNVILLAETDLSNTNNNSHISSYNFDYDYAWGFNDQLRRFGSSTDESALAGYINGLVSANNNMSLDRMVYLSNHDNNWNGDDITTNKSMAELWGSNRYLMTVLEFTMPGMPLVYNGQECDGNQKINYFEDSKITWTNDKMRGLITELSKLKHAKVALTDGNTPELRGETNVLYAQDGVIAYERVNNNRRVLVVLNLNSTEKQNCTLKNVLSGNWTLLLSGNNTFCSTASASATSVLGDMTVNIPANGYLIYEPASAGEAGMYFVTEDSWNDNTKHKMTLENEDVNYKYYTFTIPSSDFDSYQEHVRPTLHVENGWDEMALYAYVGGDKVDKVWPGETINNNALQLPDSYVRNDIAFIINNNNNGEQLDINIDPTLGKDIYLTLSADKTEYEVRYGSNPLYFKFREYVETDGYVQPCQNYFGAGNNGGAFNEETPQIACTSAVNDGGNAFNIPEPGAMIDSYKITMAQSKSDKTVGYIQVDFVPNSSAPAPGFYLETEVNINQGFDAEHELRWKMTPFNKSDDRDLDLITDTPVDLCRIIIPANKFNEYAGDDDILKFRIHEFYYIENGTFTANPNYVGPSRYVDDDFIFTSSVPQYDDCHWDSFGEGKYFVVNKQEGISTYIIKFWRTSEDDGSGRGMTRVRVELVPEYLYRGDKVDDVLNACKDKDGNGEPDDYCYLYSVDAQKFMYTGNDWGTMGSLLYDDLGIKLELRKGERVGWFITDTYQLHSTMAASSATSTMGEMIGIDANEDFLDGDGYIYCDRSNGNRWQFIPVNDSPENNMYYLRLYVEKDNYNNAVNKWYYIMQDETDPTKVKYLREDLVKNGGGIANYKSRWQLILRSELIQRLIDQNQDKFIGTNADATFLMKDQGFTRGVYDEETTDPDSPTGRGPVQWVKESADNFNCTKNNGYGNDANNGKYYNAHITGKGIVYQDVQVPVYGLYRLDLNGYCKGSETYMFYEYLKSDGSWSNANDWSKYNQTAIKTTTDDYYPVTAGEAFYLNTDYQNTLILEVPQNAKQDANGYYTIRIGVYHSGTDGYAAIDDVHLHYVGKSPFILNENDNSDEYINRINTETRKHIPVYLRRDFWQEKWNALVLPMDVTKRQLTDVFGNAVLVATPAGLDKDNPQIIRFTSIRLGDYDDFANVLTKGSMYIIYPEKLVYTNEVYRFETINAGSNEHYYYFGMHDLDQIDSQHSFVITDVEGHPSDDFSDHNSIKFIGSYFRTTAHARSYVLASDGKMYHLATELPIDGFRFQINDFIPEASGAAKLSFFIDDVQEDIATFVDMVSPTSTTSDDAVYDLAGRHVKALTPGLYIKSGKKFVVK